MKRLHSIWWTLPLLGFAALDLLLFAYTRQTGLHLRSLPRKLLTLCSALSICIALSGFARRMKPLESRWLRWLHGALTALVILAVLFFGWFDAGFSCVPECLTKLDGVPCLARETSWLDTTTDYYEAHGALFYGRYLGWREGGIRG